MGLECDLMRAAAPVFWLMSRIFEQIGSLLAAKRPTKEGLETDDLVILCSSAYVLKKGCLFCLPLVA